MLLSIVQCCQRWWRPDRQDSQWETTGRGCRPLISADRVFKGSKMAALRLILWYSSYILHVPVLIPLYPTYHLDLWPTSVWVASVRCFVFGLWGQWSPLTPSIAAILAIPTCIAHQTLHQSLIYLLTNISIYILLSNYPKEGLEPETRRIPKCFISFFGHWRVGHYPNTFCMLTMNSLCVLIGFVVSWFYLIITCVIDPF